MATIDTALQDADTSRAKNDLGPASGPAPGHAAGHALAAFRAGRGDTDRTTDLLAFAIAAERGLAATPDMVDRARREADAALGDYSIRHLHNTVEQIRQEAVAAHLGQLRPPPGFARLVAANLVALAIAGGLAAWLSTFPEVRAAVSGLAGG